MLSSISVLAAPFIDLFDEDFVAEMNDCRNAENFKAFLEFLLPFAQQGNPVAQGEVSRIYHYGWGTKKDIKQALYWDYQAAEQGYAPSQLMLSILYSEGAEVQRDYAEAYFWHLAAYPKHPEPEFAGLMTSEEKATAAERAKKWNPAYPPETIKAFAEIVLAAKAGDALAQRRLAILHENGRGTKLDGVEAEKWYRRSAEQGDAPAQNALGELYEGKNWPPELIERDIAEAAKWYRKAAERGNKRAQGNLSLLCANGNGVAKSAMEAYFWYSLAHRGENADVFIINLRKHLTPHQIDDVEARVKVWTPVVPPK